MNDCCLLCLIVPIATFVSPVSSAMSPVRTIVSIIVLVSHLMTLMIVAVNSLISVASAVSNQAVNGLSVRRTFALVERAAQFNRFCPQFEYQVSAFHPLGLQLVRISFELFSAIPATA